MPTSSGTTVGTSQAPLPTLPRSPRIANQLNTICPSPYDSCIMTNLFYTMSMD
ncbi:MAG: hypothetical protein Q8R24_04370 [Legionellaceae bacterium]|nr:hypothetical protein [Legionellaceae bacterium]